MCSLSRNVSSQWVFKCHVRVMYVPHRCHVMYVWHTQTHHYCLASVGVISVWPFQVPTINVPQNLKCFKVHINFTTQTSPQISKPRPLTLAPQLVTPKQGSWDSNQVNVGGLVMIIMKNKSGIVVNKYYTLNHYNSRFFYQFHSFCIFT